MKTFLGYLTFAALLALCYIEKMNAEAAKNEIRLRTGGRNATASGPHVGGAAVDGGANEGVRTPALSLKDIIWLSFLLPNAHNAFFDALFSAQRESAWGACQRANAGYLA